MMVVPRIKCIILAFAFALLATNVTPLDMLDIAIIGAGAAGLASAKNAIDELHNVVVYEQTGQIGGIWYYTDKTKKDEYEQDIYTPMYRGLRTNGPYHPMEYPHFHYPEGTPSYPSHDIVWKYMNDYAKENKITNKIKFNHVVKEVHPDGKKWKITVTDLPKKRNITKKFDAIFVCSGAFTKPIKPKISGAGKFKGEIIHSHQYRKPKNYEGKDVLVVGGKYV